LQGEPDVEFSKLLANSFTNIDVGHILGRKSILTKHSAINTGFPQGEDQ